MKHFSKIAMAMAVMLCAGFAACGDDDDKDEGGSGSAETQPLVDNNGNQVRLTSVGNVVFNYDANGKLVSFGEGSEVFSFSGSTITLPGSTYEYRLSYNGKGYISKMVISYDESDEHGRDKGSGSISFSYNGSGQLIGVSGTGTSEYSETYQGRTETGSEKSTINETLTWTNGNLTKIDNETKGTYINDGESSSYTENDITTFVYGSMANATKQYPYYVGDAIIGEGAGLLALTGYFGVGTANLPTKYTSEYIETETGEQPYSNSKSYTLAYTLNSNGTIDTEQRDNGRTIQYGYSNVTRAAMMANEVEAQLPVLKNMLFKRHRR